MNYISSNTSYSQLFRSKRHCVKWAYFQESVFMGQSWSTLGPLQVSCAGLEVLQMCCKIFCTTQRGGEAGTRSCAGLPIPLSVLEWSELCWPCFGREGLGEARKKVRRRCSGVGKVFLSDGTVNKRVGSGRQGQDPALVLDPSLFLGSPEQSPTAQICSTYFDDSPSSPFTVLLLQKTTTLLCCYLG